MATLQAQPGSVVGPRTRASSQRQRQLREFGMTVIVTLVGLLVLLIFLMPAGYMLSSAFMQDSQLSAQNAPLWPAKAVTLNYQGKDLPLYNVPTDQGLKRLALLEGFREESNFIDPANPGAGPINWKGRYRALAPVYQFQITWENFVNAWGQVRFPLLLRNSIILSGVGTLGTLISCILVAYGFARYRIPGKNILFVILISTIVLPAQATIIPLYIVFSKLGWTGTWLPLLVPPFFANAYDVFLLRQYFLTIPKELDEASMIDGASPLRTLVSVIIPQAGPAITAVTLFHFFWAWNEYFTPLVYLVGKEDLYPLSVGIGSFVGTFAQFPGLAMATAVMTLLLPVVAFFFAQRQFMQGIVITGVEK